MKEINRKLILTYELVKDGYIAKVTVDKSPNVIPTYSFDIYDPQGKLIPFAFRRDERTNEIKLANLVGEMIDNHIKGEPSVNNNLKTKLESAVEEMKCMDCDAVTGHVLSQNKDNPSAKAWTCINCNSQRIN